MTIASTTHDGAKPHPRSAGVKPGSRREFLASAAALGAAAFAWPAAAMQPIVRKGHQRMTLSLAAYSMRKYLDANPNSADKMSMVQYVDWASGLDVDGVELTSYFFPDGNNPEGFDHKYLTDLKRQCHLHGLEITGGAIRNNFTYPAGDTLEESFKHTEAWAAHYGVLGAPAMRVFAGVPPRGTSEDLAIQRAIPNLQRAAASTGKHGVFAALENHDYLTVASRLMDIVSKVDHPWFAVNLDSGNFFTADPYADIKAAAPYAVNVQIKVEIKPDGGEKQPADLDRVINILADSGYSGPVVLEYESNGEPKTDVPRYLEQLRKLIDKHVG